MGIALATMYGQEWQRSKTMILADQLTRTGQIIAKHRPSVIVRPEYVDRENGDLIGQPTNDDMPRLTIVWANQNFLKWSGWPEDELIGADALHTIIPDQYRANHYKNMMRHFTGDPRLIQEVDCEFIHYDGRKSRTRIKIIELYSIIGPLGGVTVSERRD